MRKYRRKTIAVRLLEDFIRPMGRLAYVKDLTAGRMIERMLMRLFDVEMLEVANALAPKYPDTFPDAGSGASESEEAQKEETK